MPMRRSRKKQQRGDGFKALVCRFLKALGYPQIEEEPKIGEKRVDLLVTTGEGRFFVEAKSPRLMKDTLFDPKHFDRVKLFERDVTQYVKKQFGTLHENCIIAGSWDGFLGRGIAAEHIRKCLGLLSNGLVERKNSRPTESWKSGTGGSISMNLRKHTSRTTLNLNRKP